MNANEDQRIQHQLDHRSTTDDPAAPDAQVYRKLYEALAAAPASPLPEGFADRMVAQAMPPKWHHRYGPMLLLAACIALSLLLCALSIYYADAAFLRSFTTQLLRFKEILAFGFTALLLIQIGDHWLIKSRPR